MTGPVLVVEDDAPVREALGQTLELAGFEPIVAGSFVVAKDHITADFIGVVLSDMRMPGRDGLHLLDYAQGVDPDLPVILLTGEGDIPMAIGAITRGAFDFLEKPCANTVLCDTVKKAARARGLVLENRRLKAELSRGDAAAQSIFGVSDLAEQLRAHIRRVAGIDDAVLIEGPPGAGIAKVARVIHSLSARCGAPMHRIAGSGQTPGTLGEHLTACAAGTLFIEEIADMPQGAQYALLEHLDGMRGARILAGMTEAAGDGALAEELRYRLQGLTVRVPALRDRAQDIPVIFRHYVAEAAEQAQVEAPDVPPQMVAELMAQDWPGNTRGLRNAAMRYVLGLETPTKSEGLGLAQKMAQVERSLIIEALVQHGGNASATAQALQLPRKTFYDKLAKHGIKTGAYR